MPELSAVPRWKCSMIGFRKQGKLAGFRSEGLCLSAPGVVLTLFIVRYDRIELILGHDGSGSFAEMPISEGA